MSNNHAEFMVIGAGLEGYAALSETTAFAAERALGT
jgi:hypothetical protein